MFRRMSNKTRKVGNESKETFLSLNAEQKVAIRSKLLQAMSIEKSTNVRNKVGDAVAEIARQYTDNSMNIPSFRQEDCVHRFAHILIDENWPELLGALFQASQSPDAGQREGAFRIFATTPGIIESQHESTVIGAFAKGFKDEAVPVSVFRSIVSQLMLIK